MHVFELFKTLKVRKVENKRSLCRLSFLWKREINCTFNYSTVTATDDWLFSAITHNCFNDKENVIVAFIADNNLVYLRT